jgi:hypothetical protein
VRTNERSEKSELVASQAGAGTRNQEELEQLYVKAAEMKIKHLLEVIDRQQDTMSSNGDLFGKTEETVSKKEEGLNKKIAELQKKAEVTKKSMANQPAKPHTTPTIKEDGDLDEDEDEDGDGSPNADRSKEWNRTLQGKVLGSEATHEEKTKKNEAMSKENSILMEQLERITTGGAKKSKVDELQVSEASAQRAGGPGGRSGRARIRLTRTTDTNNCTNGAEGRSGRARG